jgi:two-component system cell cycle sensor histidine kinase/response regulator CckA
VKRSLRVLLVEDSAADAGLLLEDIERGGFEIAHLRVETADAMRAALKDHWDVIVSDYSMPSFTGLNALRLLQESALDIPFIMVSGTIGEEAAVEALKAGASDFLVKGRLARLIPAIQREIREAGQRQARRAAETALSQARERMEFSLEAAGVGIWESDLSSGRTLWSDVQEHLHGLPAGGFRNTFDAFVDCIHPDDRQVVKDRIAESRRNRQNVRLEYRTIWPDGSVHWITGIGRTFYNASDEPIRAAGVSLEVTAQKNLQEQFHRAQKLDAIGGLAAGIAHDFNNLLTVVMGYCELLAARFTEDAAAIDDVNEIRRAGESAAALTRQLLGFSRLQIVAPRIADLNQILTDSFRMARRLIQENVQITLRLAEDLAAVDVDAGQMEQVLLNLLINARDAMPDGGMVTIATENLVLDDHVGRANPDLPAGSYVLWSVADTGSGMPPTIRNRIFEPFFTTKERGRGTGLGLATVYGIVQQSAGHIRVESEVGRGTVFRIFLPTALPREAPPPPPTRPSGHRHGHETILVVEDEAALRRITERILRAHGYTVLLAANGSEAQRVSDEHRGPIHAVLMDVVMPGPSGRLVADWMAQARPEARIIYLSGYTNSEIARHGVLEPGTRFLQKPYSSQVLLETIGKALSQDDER